MNARRYRELLAQWVEREWLDGADETQWQAWLDSAWAALIDDERQAYWRVRRQNRGAR